MHPVGGPRQSATTNARSASCRSRNARRGTAEAEPLPAGVVNRVQLSPYRVVLAGVQTWPVDYQPLTKEITAVGYVEFNERGQRTVSARVAGRIDKLFVNETGQMVDAGDDWRRSTAPTCRDRREPARAQSGARTRNSG